MHCATLELYRKDDCRIVYILSVLADPANFLISFLIFVFLIPHARA